MDEEATAAVAAAASGRKGMLNVDIYPASSAESLCAWLKRRCNKLLGLFAGSTAAMMWTFDVGVALIQSYMFGERATDLREGSRVDGSGSLWPPESSNNGRMENKEPTMHPMA